MAHMVYCDADGNIVDHPRLRLAGASGRDFFRPGACDLLALPEGSKIFFLPSTSAVGWDLSRRTFASAGPLDGPGGGAAVAALLAPGYTSNLLPAYRSDPGRSVWPLWAYTAVGWKDGAFVAAAHKVDDNPLWKPGNFDDRGLEKRIEKRIARDVGNRLLRHLAHCATRYHCFAAKNLFLERGEIPLPTAPACNARCLGCISLQPSDCCPSPQDRIAFVPTAEEVAGIVIDHFQRVPDGIASFGQGCEGEPLTVAHVIGASIRKVRSRTSSGTVNLNTNGYSPAKVKALAGAGLQSIRVSLNSLDPRRYQAYFRPKRYGFVDVMESLRTAADEGLYTAINYLFFPGVNDRREEVDKLLRVLETFRIDMIQLRNLNIDPDLYMAAVPPSRGERLGVRGLMEAARAVRPDLVFGYFNRPRPAGVKGAQ